MSTLFEKILHKEIESEILYENDKLFVIKDKYPQAPVHLLIISKKVIPNLQAIGEEDDSFLSDVVRVAQQLAEEFEIAESGYRLLTNNGAGAGQTIFHLHFHLLGGRKLGAEG